MLQSTEKHFSLVGEDSNGKLKFETFPIVNESSIAFVVGIIGSQKLGKSTLANALYGTHFKTGDNLDQRTTQGIDGCYVKQGISFPNEDTIILDCEGDKSHQKKQSIKEEVGKLKNLTDEEKQRETELLLKTSDTRYANLLWCAVNCLVVLLPDSPPNNDILHFFELINEGNKRIEATNHRVSVILVFRTSKRKSESLTQPYLKVLSQLTGFSSLVIDLKILHIPDYEEDPPEERYQNALNNLKLEINAQCTKHEKFSPSSWKMTLQDTIRRLNTDVALEDLNFLKIQNDLNLILSRNPEKVFSVAECLENMVKSRELINTNVNHDLLDSYKARHRELADLIKDKTARYKVAKTVKSVGVLGYTGAALFFPPAALGAIVLGLEGLWVDHHYSGKMKQWIQEFENESKTARDMLQKNNQLIVNYKQNFEKARDTLVYHEKLLSRLEFFYAITRAILRKEEPEASAKECLRYLFTIFESSKEIKFEGYTGELKKSSECSLFQGDISNPGQWALAGGMGRALGAGAKGLAQESGSILGLAGILEVYDCVTTWNTDQSKVLDMMDKDEEKLNEFMTTLEKFWEENRETMSEVEEIVGDLMRVKGNI